MLQSGGVQLLDVQTLMAVRDDESVRAVNFSALDAFTQLLLERSQYLIAPFRILPVLLIIVQPERRIHADKHQHQLRDPAAKARQNCNLGRCCHLQE